ncbi:hypothetical protein [Streptomyces ipomoeae]|uniref:hypothetical protein n=1 Tax=Streptomyces ipomoeae TaxID=103232 RepID=UPI001146CD76|nr:hypothetical protein [Streptomyces ipomoeae]TQE33102.1 hypothetical protein Sipo7851_21630 [Streptomyces ipomoeae]
MSTKPVANRSSRLRRLAAELSEKYELDWGRGERIEPEYDDARREWTYRWFDGPTVEQVKRAARKADREATEGLKYRREFSQQAVALGVIRLAMDPDIEVDLRDHPYVTPTAVEELWRTVSKPRPRDAREEAMITAIVTTANGDRGRGWAQAYEICKLVQEQGLAVFLRRSGAELTPIERLTDRYASSPASLAWSYRLTPMTPLAAFSAVQADEKAKPEAVADALTLLPKLHAELDAAAAALQARVTGEAQDS